MKRGLAILLGIVLPVPVDPVMGAELDLSTARARAVLSAVSPGSDVVVVLRDGVRVEGVLSEVVEEGFSLFVPISRDGTAARIRAAAVETHWSFEQVHRVEPSKPAWIPPDRVGILAKGQKVEVLLLTGRRVSGQLESVTQEKLFLARGREVLPLAFDDVAAVRKNDLSRGAKIAVGIAVGFVLFGLASYAIVGGQAQ